MRIEIADQVATLGQVDIVLPEESAKPFAMTPLPVPSFPRITTEVPGRSAGCCARRGHPRPEPTLKCSSLPRQIVHCTCALYSEQSPLSGSTEKPRQRLY